jgi:hypothetical protein
VRDRKPELVKEINVQGVEERGFHVGKKCFQVSTNTPELKGAEVWKSDVSYDRHAQQLSLDLTIGDRGEEAYLKVLQLR